MVLGKWRWPLVFGFSLLAGAALYFSGTVRLKYDGRAVLAFSGNASQLDDEMKMFRSASGGEVVVEKVPGQPLEVSLHAQANRPLQVVSLLDHGAKADIEQSFAAHKKTLQDLHDGFQKQATTYDVQFAGLTEDRKTLRSGPHRKTPKASLSAKWLDLDRRINEVQLRRDYFLRRASETNQELAALKPAWRLAEPIQKPTRPYQVENWPVGAGTLTGIFLLGGILFRKKRQPAIDISIPTSDVLPLMSEVEVPLPSAGVALEIVSPEVPSDPLTEKAAALYHKWIEVAKILYTPAPEAPQGVLDQVGPLLQESSDFLPEGHDVLARYLARVTTSGDLASHVARTVLMTLTGAEEAGVSPEHRLAMALAALFHDLAVVPRPEAMQEEVGSDVGRLSASVLPRIPGLAPALLSMVEDILIGMDEYKLETWQNGSSGMALEPLSKVLREIDRFEKVMQKQKARLDRRIANQ